MRKQVVRVEASLTSNPRIRPPEGLDPEVGRLEVEDPFPARPESTRLGSDRVFRLGAAAGVLGTP